MKEKVGGSGGREGEKVGGGQEGGKGRKWEEGRREGRGESGRGRREKNGTSMFDKIL